MLPTLIYEKETVDLEEVIRTLLSEERKLSGESNETFDDLTLTIGNWKKNNSKKKGVYWVCGQLGDLKKDCQKINEASSASCFKSIYEDTDSITNRKYHYGR